MSVKQLSIFVENRAGRISEITEILDQAGVSIRGFSIADTVDYGIVRIVTDKPQAGHDALAAAGFLLQTNDVICIELPDIPGELARVFKAVSEAGVDVSYSYSLVSTYVVLRVDDIEAAERQLASQPVRLIDQDELAVISLKGAN